MTLLIQVVTKANEAQTLLVWGSICKQVVCSLMANWLDSHKYDNMKVLGLLELKNERLCDRRVFLFSLSGYDAICTTRPPDTHTTCL